MQSSFIIVRLFPDLNVLLGDLYEEISYWPNGRLKINIIEWI